MSNIDISTPAQSTSVSSPSEPKVPRAKDVVDSSSGTNVTTLVASATEAEPASSTSRDVISNGDKDDVSTHLPKPSVEDGAMPLGGSDGDSTPPATSTKAAVACLESKDATTADDKQVILSIKTQMSNVAPSWTQRALKKRKRSEDDDDQLVDLTRWKPRGKGSPVTTTKPPITTKPRPK